MQFLQFAICNIFQTNLCSINLNLQELSKSFWVDLYMLQYVKCNEIFMQLNPGLFIPIVQAYDRHQVCFRLFFIWGDGLEIK